MKFASSSAFFLSLIRRHRLGAWIAALIFMLPLSAAHASSEWRTYTTPGGQAPLPLKLTDLSGNLVDLSAVKGQVVLLNFWATWCEPCRDEMPAMDRLHRKLAPKGLKVLAVNVGEGKGKIERFLREVPVDFSILRDDDSAASKAWRVRMLPVTFLIDRQGMLRRQVIGEADWDAAALQAPILELLN